MYIPILFVCDSFYKNAPVLWKYWMPLQTGYKKEQFESTEKCHVFLMFCILLYISRVYHIIDCQSAPPGVAFDASRTNARHWSCLDTRAGQRLATPDQQLADLTCDLYAKGKTCPHGTLCRLSRYGYWVVWLSFSFLWVGPDQIHWYSTYISMRVPVPRYLQTSKVSVKSLSLAFLFLLALFEISAFCCLRKCRTSKLDSKAFVSFTISILSWIHGVCKKMIIHILLIHLIYLKKFPEYIDVKRTVMGTGNISKGIWIWLVLVLKMYGDWKMLLGFSH